MATLKITLTRGTNRSKVKQVATIQALGLNKIGSVVEKTDTPPIRGMVRKVAHLVTVEEN